MFAFLRPDRFESFGTLLAGGAAGWHDGKKITLEFDSLGDDVVFLHEQAHDTIFLRTPDGALLSAIYSLLDYGRGIDERTLKAMQATAQTLFDASHEAHEIAATYIGIKSLDPSKIPDVEGRLPFTYNEYYQAAARVIDPFVTCTYLQVLMLSTIAHYAFGSRFLAQFVSYDWRRYTSLKADFTPNDRLTRLLSYLGEGRMAELRSVVDAAAAVFFADAKYPPWELHSEEAWSSAEPRVAAVLERHITRAIERWLMAGNVVPYLEQVEYKKALLRLQRMCARYGLELTTSDEDPVLPQGSDLSAALPDLNAFAEAPPVRMAAERYGSSLISNSNLLEGDRLSLTELLVCRQLVTARRLIVLAADPFDSASPWTIVGVDPAEGESNCTVNARPGYAAQVLQNSVVRWLQSIGASGSDAWQGPEPSSIGVVVDNRGAGGGLRDGYALLEERWQPKAVCYAVGNWAYVIEAAGKLGKVAATELITHIDPAGGGAAPVPVHVLIARCEGLGNRCFFRPLAQGARYAMLPLEHVWRQQPWYSALTPGEADAAGINTQAVIDGFTCQMAFWSAY